jgi:hypothetical protein
MRITAGYSVSLNPFWELYVPHTPQLSLNVELPDFMPILGMKPLSKNHCILRPFHQFLAILGLGRDKCKQKMKDQERPAGGSRLGNDS